VQTKCNRKLIDLGKYKKLNNKLENNFPTVGTLIAIISWTVDSMNDVLLDIFTSLLHW
jgi:hypothetical protein